ncbi:MAG: hypothetical protein NT007_00980 [Candidatus Kapabacteria bacterium]|nr:hypothetical protein [Candidatus Kapabacteria bacterium]
MSFRMIGKYLQDGSLVHKVNHRKQTPEDNLDDICSGFFNSVGLSKAELMSIFNDCVKIADQSYELAFIAELIITEVSEESAAIAVYHKAEEISETACDYYVLAGSILEYLQDLSWGLELYEKAIVIVEDDPDLFDCIFLAEVYCKNIPDYIRSRKLYELAEQCAITMKDFKYLADSILKNLNDEQWYLQLIEKAHSFNIFPIMMDDICMN